MPELPEVEYAARRMRAAVTNQTINSAIALHPSTARSLTPDTCRTLIGRRVLTVERRAKVQLLHLDDGSTLVVHFRMTGDWDIGQTTDPSPTYERARFTFLNGVRVSFIDSRAFGVLALHAPGNVSLPSFGPEPLSDAFSATVLQAALATKRGPIKPVLLDQRVVAGLGNIYAAEALWVAGIRPETAANRIARARIVRLRDAIQQVLREAPSTRYSERGASAVELATDGPWHVYDREGQRCTRCHGVIARIVQAGRSTFLCRRCQR